MASPCPHCGSPEGPEHVCGASQMALIGQVLDGRYRIEEAIGQGGMGMVFRATQTSVHRPVAVKTLSASLAAAPLFFERFRREAEIASRLHHPNVITIYDFGRAQDGTCYYVMELLEGESLRELVKRDGPMSLRRAVDIIEQACRGLAHAHEQGAVHRDIKPHNIMVQQLDRRDFVKVLDFGLVKALEQDDEQQLTSTGQVLGTPQYMPPEQASGEVVDHRSDLYSMGGVFYYCLTGTSPYGANTVRKALTAALTQPPPTVAAKRQGAPVPRAVEDFFQKAFAREKEDRFQSAQELVDAMLDAVAGLSPEELDALPSGSTPEAGSGNRPSQRSVTRLGRSSPSAVRGRGPVLAARGGSQPLAARGAQPVARSPQPSGMRGTRGGGAAASGSRQKSALPATPPRQNTQSLEETHRRSAGKKVVLVVVPLLLIAAAGAILIVLRTSLSTEAPPPPITEVKKEPVPTQKPAVDSMILVHLQSTPTGAAIFEGDAQLGKTPLDLQLRRDEIHELTFRLAEHQDVKRKLDFTGVLSDAQGVDVTLEPVKPAPAERSPKPAPPVKQGKSKEKDDISVFE